MEDASGFEVFRRLKEASGFVADNELAQLLGLSRQSIAKAKATKSVPAAWIPKASATFGVTTDWLFFGTGAKNMDKRTAIHEPSPYVQNGEEVDLVMVPRVAARLSAGAGSLDTESEVKGHYAFRSDWICKKGNVSRMVCMDVTGDSMLPEIKHADMVLIDQSKQEIVPYGLFAMGIEDSVYIKQLRTLPGKLVLHSLNPDYEDIILDTTVEQPESVRVIGRVIWVARELV